ncbi:MAG: nucleotide exchange factor GrpE [Methanoregula sp.]|nr:nucleotide exchange factor GrpE [Methanoregula sp.]
MKISHQKQYYLPGITAVGFLLIFLALLRYGHWSNVNIVFCAGIGVLLTLIGIDLHFSGKPEPLLICGSILLLIAICLYRTVFFYITDSLALIAGSGISLIFVHILIKTWNLERGNPKIIDPALPATDCGNAETAVFEQYLTRLRQAHQKLRAQGMDDLEKKERENLALITALLKFRDSLETILRQDPSNKILSAQLSEIEEVFQDFHITEISPAAGDKFDPHIHIDLEHREIQTDTPIIRLVRKGYRKLEPDGSIRTLRIAVVDMKARPGDDEQAAEQVND